MVCSSSYLLEWGAGAGGAKNVSPPTLFGVSDT